MASRFSRVESPTMQGSQTWRRLRRRSDLLDVHLAAQYAACLCSRQMPNVQPCGCHAHDSEPVWLARPSPKSGRTVARSGLRMMPTFPPSPLSVGSKEVRSKERAELKTKGLAVQTCFVLIC